MESEKSKVKNQKSKVKNIEKEQNSFPLLRFAFCVLTFDLSSFI